MINKDGGDNFSILWGGHSCYEGGHRAHGGIPPVPPTRENPALGTCSRVLNFTVIVHGTLLA